jgi:hypothetical protein
MGLTEQLHKIIEEFGHLLPGHHVKTLQEAGEALAVEPDSETPTPRYVPPEIPAEDRRSGPEFEAQAAAEVAQAQVDDEALLSPDPTETAPESSSGAVGPTPLASPTAEEPGGTSPPAEPDPTTTIPTPSTSSEGSSGASSTP